MVGRHGVRGRETTFSRVGSPEQTGALAPGRGPWTGPPCTAGWPTTLTNGGRMRRCAGTGRRSAEGRGAPWQGLPLGQPDGSGLDHPARHHVAFLAACVRGRRRVADRRGGPHRVLVDVADLIVFGLCSGPRGGCAGRRMRRQAATRAWDGGPMAWGLQPLEPAPIWGRGGRGQGDH